MASAIGAQLYTLRDYMKTPADIRASMRKVRQLGFETVQVSGLGPIDPRELGEIARGEGIAIVATHIGYDRIRDEPQAVIDEHKLWDCPHVAIGGMPQEFRSAEGFERFAKEASEAARPLIDADLSFSYHNHSFELERIGPDRKTGLDILVENSDPAVFSFEIDTYWIQHGGGNPVSWLHKLSDRMRIVHFKDMEMRGMEQLFAEVGRGNLEWPEIIAACRNADIDYYLIEQDRCQRDPFESLKMSLEFLRSAGLQ